MADPTKAAFDAAAQKVMQTAPAGLSRDDFFALIDKELQAPSPAPDAPQVEASKHGTSAGLTLEALAKLSPAAAWEAMRFGTSPTAAKTGSAIARGLTTVGAAAHGAYTMNPTEIVAAPLEGWAAGKGGYWGTKMLQGVARPVAAGLEKITPVLNAAAGAQGVNDLAQMAEPGRKDIGVLGVGPSADNTPSPEALKQIPAAVNAVKFLIAQGAAPADAVKQVTGGNPALMGPVMMALMQTRQVK